MQLEKEKNFIPQDHPISVDPNPKKTFGLFTQQQTHFFYRCSKSFLWFWNKQKDKYVGKEILKTQNRQIFLLPKTI